MNTTIDILPYTIWKNAAFDRITSPKISIITTFYNSFSFFEKVFPSIERQTLPSTDFEVIICDDGSTTQEVSALRALLQNSTIPCLHVHHADKGFRKSEILNKGTLYARGQYLLFSDGDCILHPQLLTDHLAFLAPNTALAGRVMRLTPWLSSLITPARVAKGWLEKNIGWMFVYALCIPNTHAIKGVRITSPWLFNFFNKKNTKCYGSNTSMSRADFFAIGGYDMRFQVYGEEDIELSARIRKKGIKILGFRHRAIQYHLYHPTRRNPSKPNEAMYDASERDNVIYTPYGVGLLQEKNYLSQ